MTRRLICGVLPDSPELLKFQIYCSKDGLTEAQLYTKFCSILRDTLPKTVQVKDTHKNRYLDDRAPDISIFPKDIHLTQGTFIHTIIEVKAVGTGLTMDTRGQVLDCIERLAACQQHGHSFTALLTNINENVFLRVDYSQNEPKTLVYDPCELRQALSFLGEIITTPDEQPAIYPFPEALGTCQAFLGRTHSSAVASFWLHLLPKDLVTVSPLGCRTEVAVKVSTGTDPAIRKEIEILKRLGDNVSIPRLVFYDQPHSMFGMLPVGNPVRLDSLLFDSFLARAVLNNVLDWLLFLHDNSDIHRDLRWGNIITSQGRAIIIDFNHSYIIPSPNSPPKAVMYQGGYCCAPPPSSL